MCNNQLTITRERLSKQGVVLKESQGTYPFLIEREWIDALGRSRMVGLYCHSLEAAIAIVENGTYMFPDKR